MFDLEDCIYLKKKYWYNEFERDYMRYTAFQIACKKGHFKIVELLIQKSGELKIDLNAKNFEGNSALHMACSYGHTELVHMLLQKSVEFNIDLNAKNRFGTSAFHSACTNGHNEIVQMFC